MVNLLNHESQRQVSQGGIIDRNLDLNTAMDGTFLISGSRLFQSDTQSGSQLDWNLSVLAPNHTIASRLRREYCNWWGDGIGSLVSWEWDYSWSCRTRSCVYSTFESWATPNQTLHRFFHAMFPSMFLVQQVQQNTGQTKFFPLNSAKWCCGWIRILWLENDK